MNQFALSLASLGACAMLSLPHSVSGQTGPAIPAAITTPDETDAMLLFKSASMKFNIEHESTIEIAIKSLDLSSAASEVDDL